MILNLKSQLHHGIGADFLLFAQFLAEEFAGEDVDVQRGSVHIELLAGLVHGRFHAVIHVEIW